MLGHEKLLFNSPFLLCISIAFLLFSIVLSQITLGSKLSVVENNSWVSPNGDFAIGFFNHLNQYSIGIRINSNSIPKDKQTVIWVVGADLTVGNKSYFQLTENGELVLFDSIKEVIAWRSKTTNSSVASAVLLDSGNFVLLNGKKGIVWQSFDTPSDTLVPGQNLSVFQTLRAASRNSVSSYYSLHMIGSGQLQLKWESELIYWTTPISSQSNLRATLVSDGTLRLFDQSSKPVWSVFGEDHSDSDVKFRFLRLDVDGNLRLYSWVEASRSWMTVWQAVDNQCNVFATCGLCGVCFFNASGSALCKCPFTSLHESNSKCLIPYGQDCKSGSFLIPYEHTFLYGIYPPNDTIIQTSLQKCKSICQKDPSCTAVTFTNDGTALCRIKKTKYVTGYSDPSLSSISFVKKCSDPMAIFPLSPSPPSSSSSAHDDSPKGSKRICIPCLIGVGLGTFVSFMVIQLGIGFCIYKRRKAYLARKGPNPKGLVMLSYTEIKDLTGNFKDQIGPKMFKGVFLDQSLVVVKDVSVITDDRKFRNVVSKIGSIYHKNLVKLEGYCCESGHRFLVYEFVKNGSLGQCIEDSKICKKLSWKKRMDICLTVARAVSYLHTECREFISHGNLKCDNVVLDENLEAKVSEFGLGRVRGDESDGGGEAECDVRDFGKMVLVLISGAREDNDFRKWAYEKLLEGEAEGVVDERLEGGVNSDELERALRIGFWCLHGDSRMRPSMGEVVKVLEGNLSVDPPTFPFLPRRSLEGEEEELVDLESDETLNEEICEVVRGKFDG